MLTGIPLLEESPARQSIFSLRGHYWSVGRGGTRDKKFSSCNLIKQKSNTYIPAKVSRKVKEGDQTTKRSRRIYLLALPARNIWKTTHACLCDTSRCCHDIECIIPHDSLVQKEITARERRFTRFWRFSHVTFVAFKRFPFSDWFAAINS